MQTRSRVRGRAALALLALTAACTDQLPTIAPPTTDPAVSRTRIDCRATVSPAAVQCTVAGPSTGSALGDRLVGGQDVYVKLASRNTAYDGGTQIFSTEVSLQNLMNQAMTGARVFFPGEPVGVGGTVTVNGTGTDFFTGPDQSYFAYPEAIGVFAMSTWRPWTFTLDAGVTSFTFSVYVEAQGVSETGPLHDATWTGAQDSAWTDAANWEDGSMPGTTSNVFIPSDSMMSGAMPMLVGDAQVGGVRVGTGSALYLDGHRLEASGTVDATGTISGGTVAMTGAGAKVMGTLDALEVSGSVALQGATRTTGAVSVTGSLTITDQALSIQAP